MIIGQAKETTVIADATRSRGSTQKETSQRDSQPANTNKTNEKPENTASHTDGDIWSDKGWLEAWH